MHEDHDAGRVYKELRLIPSPMGRARKRSRRFAPTFRVSPKGEGRFFSLNNRRSEMDEREVNDYKATFKHLCEGLAEHGRSLADELRKALPEIDKDVLAESEAWLDELSADIRLHL